MSPRLRGHPVPDIPTTVHDLPEVPAGPAQGAVAAVVEYGLLQSSGGYRTRNPDPEVERIYPVAEWIAAEIRHGHHVFRRRIIVVEDWTEVTEP